MMSENSEECQQKTYTATRNTCLKYMNVHYRFKAVVYTFYEYTYIIHTVTPKVEQL